MRATVFVAAIFFANPAFTAQLPLPADFCSEDVRLTKAGIGYEDGDCTFGNVREITAGKKWSAVVECRGAAEDDTSTDTITIEVSADGLSATVGYDTGETLSLPLCK